VKFLIISEGGDGSGLALRLKEEGHDAKIWIRDPESEHRCLGLIDTATEYSSGQVVVADCTGAGALLEAYRDSGVPTVGGSAFCDRLEGDRAFASSIFKKAGIRTPKAISVKTWDEAAEATSNLGSGDSKGKVALKPEGRFSGVVPSYVSYDEEDAYRMLEHFKQTLGGGEIELTVQEFIEGTAVSTEGWFNGESWVEGMFNHTIERKQFLNDDLGPSGGCTGNLVWGCSSTDPLVEELLTPLTDILREHVYRGAIDVNAVVNEEGCFALEFTPRFGYDAFPTLLTALCDFDFGVFLCSLACGYLPSGALGEGFGAGVRISIPPWPSEEFHAQPHVPIAGLSANSRQWLYPNDIQLGEDGELESSGGYGILGVVNGHGYSIDEAFDAAYKICNKLRVPNKQYRTDLAVVMKKDFRALNRVFEGELTNAN